MFVFFLYSKEIVPIKNILCHQGLNIGIILNDVVNATGGKTSNVFEKINQNGTD
jgi:hypothetical protein